MEFLYIAGVIMMAALALKIGFVVYKNLIVKKQTENKKTLNL